MTQAELYFDHNATTPPAPEVIETVTRVMREAFANPGSRHAAGRRARRVLEESRESLAAILGANPEEVVFTSGGTESNTLAIRGLCGSNRGTLLSGPGEHPSVAETCARLVAEGFEIHELPISVQGNLIKRSWELFSTEPVRLVTLLLAHNETGVIQNVAPLAAWCAEQKIPLHLDGVQAVGKIPVNFHESGAMTLSLAAHKFHGPRGIGALLVRKGLRLTPQLVGGHQEQERRAGTEAVALIAGMATALELWHKDADARTKKITALRDQLQAGLERECVPVLVHGEGAARLPNTLNIAFPGLDGEALLVALDLAGVACSLGSTCASGSMEPAPILLAMSCPPELAKSSVRFSLGHENTPEEIDAGIRRIAEIVNRMRGK